MIIFGGRGSRGTFCILLMKPCFVARCCVALLSCVTYDAFFVKVTPCLSPCACCRGAEPTAPPFMLEVVIPTASRAGVFVDFQKGLATCFAEADKCNGFRVAGV